MFATDINMPKHAHIKACMQTLQMNDTLTHQAPLQLLALFALLAKSLVARKQSVSSSPNWLRALR